MILQILWRFFDLFSQASRLKKLKKRKKLVSSFSFVFRCDFFYKGTTLKISPDREYEYVNGNAGTFLVNLVPF